MMRVSHFVGLVAVAAIVTACGSKQEPEPVTPAVDTAAMNRARQDSIDAARRAEEERARQEAERQRQAAEAARAQAKQDLTAPIHFDYDQASVMGNDQQLLDRKVAILQANPGVQLQISGHADARGSDEYNLALGNRRAAAAKRYLTDHGIDASRLNTVSYGEERPVAQGDTEEAYAQNRRDEFEITSGGDNLNAPQ